MGNIHENRMNTIKKYTMLDIGSGRHRRPNTLCLDKSPLVNPDVLHDLDIYPYPFEDNTFEYIYCHHVIEHIADIVRFMEEVHRILKPGGNLMIYTPHFSSSNSWTDPTHNHHLGYFSFDYFSDNGDKENDLYSSARFHITLRRFEFQSRLRFLGIAWIANRFPRAYEKYYCWRFPAKNIHFEMTAIKNT